MEGSGLDLELLASIASGGLGQWVEGKDGQPVYAKSEDCIGCLRDLQRFFRYDDPEERPAFFAVHKYNLARSDLVPLIVTYPDEYDVVYNALKVCTFLTMPSATMVKKNMAQQAEHMQRVREAFLAQDALAVVVGLLADPLSRHPRMKDEDKVMVQLVITFLRNLVAIPQAAPPAAGSATGAEDANRRIKRGLLERLFADNVMDLLLLLAQHAREQPFRSEAPVLVETFLHLLRGLEAEHLLDAEVALKAEQAQRAQQAAAQAAAARKRPTAPGAALPGLKLPPRPGQVGLVHLPKALVVGNRMVAQNAPSRHARSDAVFVRRHSDHNRNVVLRNNPSKTELPALPAVTNRKQAKAELREGLVGTGRPRLGAELLLRMRGFLEQFLEGGYGILMGQVFKEVQPGLGVSRLDQPEFLSFVELATLATRYIRVKEERKLRAKQQQEKEKEGGNQEEGSRVAAAAAAGGPAAGQAQQQGEGQEGEGEGKAGSQAEGEGQEEASPFTPISATMGWDTFYWCMKLWLQLKDDTKRRPNDSIDWDLQHASVPMLKEMLLALDLARLVGTAADKRAADRLQRRLLHDDLKDSGLLPVLAGLIKKYNFRFQPRSHAVDLIETLHIVLGMMDRLSAAEAGGFRVRRVAKAKPVRRTKAPKHAAPQIEEDGEGASGAAAEERQEGPGAQGGSQEPPNSPAAAAAAPAAGEESAVARPASAGAEEGQEEGAAASPLAKAEAPTASRAAAESSGGGGGGATPAAKAPGVTADAARSEADCVSIAGTPAGGGPRSGAGAGAASPTALATAAKGGGRTRDPLEEEDAEEEEGQGGGDEVRCSHYQEFSLDVAKRVKQELAYPVILHFYSWLLQGYATNAPFTNHAITALFSRIADPQGLNLEPMLYQLSVLRVLHAILADGSLRKRPEFGELIHFATRVVRNMFARLVPDLSELEAAVAAGEAAASDAAEVGDNQGGSSVPVEEAVEAKRRAEVEIKLHEGTAALQFVEILFWKGANVAESIRDEYKWKSVLHPEPPRRRGGRRRAGGGLSSGEESEGGGGLVGFGGGARSGKPTFDDERAEQLRAAFEKCNGRKDCLDLLVHEFGGLFKKAHISRQLKAMGLAKGKLTERQEESLRALYPEHSYALDAFDLIAEELGAGFSAGQVKRQLRKMGLVAPSKKARKAGAGGGKGTAWDALGDDDSSGDEGGARRAAGSMSPELGAGGEFGSDSESGSDAGDDASGFESAKSDLDSSGDEGEDGKDRALQRLTDTLGGKKARAPPATLEPSPEFGAFSPSDDELALGAGAPPAGGSRPQPPVRKRLRKAGGSGKPDGGAGLGVDSEAGHSSGSESDSEAEAGQKRPRQQLPLGAATQELVPSTTPWPAAGKAKKAKQAGAAGKAKAAVAPKPQPKPAAKRPASSGSSSSSGEESEGGSFVTLQGSEGSQGAAAEEDTAAAQPAKKARKAAAADLGPASGKAQQQQQRKAVLSSPDAAGADSQGSSSDSDSGAGFLSAGEEELGGDVSRPPQKAQQLRAAGGKQAKAAAPKRQRQAAAEGSSSDDEAPLWSPPAKASKPGRAGAAPAGARKKKEARPSPEGGKENSRRQAGGGGGEKRLKGGKGEAPAPRAGPDSKQRAAALEALRRKRLGRQAGSGGGEEEGQRANLPPLTEPFGEWPESEQPAPAAAAPQGAKPAGRRLLKKAGGGAPAPAPVAMLEDLEDF